MRLTLRTLLAWLDDTLSPSEVREIGKQVAESPFAKELVEKINLVTRQRRLTVPEEDTDPAMVARYLDNELEPDDVAALEKTCLTSDVHLAEVASVHQILSLIGQKAKVPTEARRRMYQLIKGREAVTPLASRASRQIEPAPRAEVVRQPWVTTSRPSRPVWEHYGPAAAVFGLMLILALTAWKTLSTPEAPQPYVHVTDPDAALKGDAAKNKAAALTNPETKDPKDEKPATTDAAKSKKETETAATTSAPKDALKEKPPGEMAETTGGEPKPAAATVVAPTLPGAVGLVRKPSGVVLKFNTASREWDRVSAAAPLREQDRLLNLEPFRTTLELGTAEVDLVGGTELWTRSTPSTYAAKLTLAQGRVVLHGTAPSLPFEVLFGGRTVKVTPPPGGKIGVERVNRRPRGAPKALASVVRFYAADGPATIQTNADSLTLDGAGAVTVETDGSFSDQNTQAPPHWVTESEPVPHDQFSGEELIKLLPTDRPVLASLVEASEHEQKEVCRLAISALYALGDVSMVVPLLNDKSGESASIRRKSTIAALRNYLAQGPDAARELRVQLQRVVGDELAATTEKLLVGYTPKEAEEEATYTKLVQVLGGTDPGEVGVRELALDNLMELTGRDDLDYNPEKPEGKGFKAWRDLLLAKELKPPASTAKPAPSTPKAVAPATKGAAKAGSANAKGAASKGEKKP